MGGAVAGKTDTPPTPVVRIVRQAQDEANLSQPLGLMLSLSKYEVECGLVSGIR